MLNVQKKQVKTIEDYRHNIKLLKYHLKKQKKTNEKLKYESAKLKHRPQTFFDNKNRVYELTQTVKIVSERLKRMGLILQDVFRMADSKYQGEINKQQFMKVVGKLKTDLTDNVFLEMFYNIDTSLNGLISRDEFLQFSIAYGGCSDPKQIRRYQNQIKSKLYNLLLKKHGSLQQFLSTLKDPTPIDKLASALKQLGLNNSEEMTILKTFDPSRTGSVNHNFIRSIMETVKIKTQKQQQGEEETRAVNDFCVMFRDAKINPIVVFEEADADGKEGVTPLELERAFIRQFPKRTPFEIRKFISMINFNNDNEITKEQYLNTIKGFYSLNQLTKFNEQNRKKHPQKYEKQRKQKQKLGQISEESVQQILRKLSNAIEDKQMKKKQAFRFIDYNNNQRIDKQEMLEGLKSLGVPVGLIGNVIAVFDRNNTEEIQMDQWLRILGADEEMSQVQIPESEEEEEDDKRKEKEKQKAPKVQQFSPSKAPQKTTKPNNVKPASQAKQNKNENKKKIPEDKQSPSKLQQSKKNQPKPTSLNKKDSKAPIKQSAKKDTKKNSKNEEPKKNNMNDSKNKPASALKKKQSKIPEKKFQQDNDSSILDSISKKPEAKKKQSKKPEKAEKPSQDPLIKRTTSNDLNEDQPQDNEVNTAEAEERIGISYKKNKGMTLKKFKDLDLKEKGYVNFKNFKDIMKKFDVNQQVAKQIFENNVINGNEFRYKEWLQDMSQMYAQDVEEEEEQVEVEEKEDKEEEEPHFDQIQEEEERVEEMQQQRSENQKEVKKPDPSQKNDKNKASKFDKKDSKQEKQEKQIYKDLINNLIPMLQKEDEKNKDVKRGQNNDAFQILNKLIKAEGKKTDKGYKLFDFISDQQGQLKNSRQKLLQKAKQLQQKSQLFKDKDFPAAQSSISPSSEKDSGIKNSSLLEWKHYSEIYKNKNVQLFKGQIQPNDIRQGQLGDCYFLSSLAGLAEYKNLIERLFQFYDLKIGYFLIWLCIDGEWRIVQVDGYLPVWPNGERPAFSYSGEDEIWVSILQKAYAKCYGCYKRIIGGQPCQAIKDLTGSPGLQYLFSKFTRDQIWQKLFDANKKQYIMAAGTKIEELNAKIEGHDENTLSNGIVLGHAYSILDCQEIDGEKILKLRNPWGEFEWSGDQWSDKGKKWTPQMKKKLNHQINENDGIFWITLPQFYTNFMSITINQLLPAYYYRSSKLKGVQQMLVSLPVREFTHGFLMMSHRDHRHSGLPVNTPYDGIYSMLGFVQSQGKVIEKFQEKKFLYQREGYVQFKGVDRHQDGAKAIVLINLEKTTNVTLAYYGDRSTEFQLQTDCKGYIQKLAYYDENSPKAQTYRNEVKIWQSSIQGSIYLCVKNLKKQNLKIQITIKQPKNIRMLPPFTAENKLDIKSGEIQCIKIKITGNPYSYSYGISF